MADADPGDEARSPDGRRVRRERNRTAVIDAMLSLLDDRVDSPPVEAVAAAAGVSVSSVFRYFDNLEDLLHETVHRYFERYAELFTIPGVGEGPRDERVRRYVDRRLDLYESVAPIARVARRQASVHPEIAETLAGTRAVLTEQVRDHFRSELAGRTPSEAGDVVAIIDSMTSFEAWDLLHTGQGRSRRLIRRAWVRGISAVLSS